MSMRPKYVYKDYPCQGETLRTEVSVPDTVVYRDQRARDHRAKPAKPFLSPTPRALASTRSMSYGSRQFNGLPLKELVCGGCQKPGHPWCWQRSLEEWYDYFPLYPSTESLATYLTFEWEPWQNKLWQRVNDWYTTVGEDAVQWRKTATFFNSFTQSAQQAWAAYQYAKRGKFSKAKHTIIGGKLGVKKPSRSDRRHAASLASKATAGAVLGWNFGTAPTISTLQEALKKLVDTRGAPPWEKLTVFQTSSAQAEIGGGPGQSKYQIRGTKTRRYVFYATRQGGVNPLAITLGNPAELLYNLMPWSWLVDYFIGIGDYLSNMPPLGVSLSDGSVTEKGLYTATQTADYDGWTTTTPAMGSHEYHVRSVIKSNEVPVPQMQWWKPDPTWNQVVNATAVWRTLRK